MKRVHLTWVLVSLILSLSVSLSAQTAPEGSVEEIFNFGHVGIDYVVSHDFAIINSGPKPIRIDSLRQTCDCTDALVMDSIIPAGDTGHIRIFYSTKDDYGLVSKALKVYTNDIKKPLREYYYVATVGRWLAGLKPDPINLFFLPGAAEKKVNILNDKFDSYEISMENPPDTFVAVTIQKPKPRKGGKAELSVVTKSDLKPGTYLTSFRLKAVVPGINEPVYLTIPVKVVRY